MSVRSVMRQVEKSPALGNLCALGSCIVCMTAVKLGILTWGFMGLTLFCSRSLEVSRLTSQQNKMCLQPGTKSGFGLNS